MKEIEVKSPWDSLPFEKIKTNNSSEIEQILLNGYNLSLKKAIEFPLYKRIEVLKKFSYLIKKNIDFLANQAVKEGGKPLKDTLIEINRGFEGVESCIEVLKNEAGSVIPMNLNLASKDRIAFTQKEPIGLVLAISAFNHPFNLIIHQIIPAIAVGCPVIVKPSEDTPLSCISIIKMLQEAGLPSFWCQLIIPEDIKLATKIVEDNRISFLSFIGSSKVGWFLRSRLAPGTRCALEHGGMAPVFIEDDIDDMDETIKAITKGAFYHAGQVCVSVQKIFIKETIFEEFINKLKINVEKLIVGDPNDINTEVGPLIRPNEVDRIDEWVNESKINGANVITGGSKLSKTTYEPTIISDVNETDKLSNLEVFGPLVNVYQYNNLSDAILLANNCRSSFQSSIFTNKINLVLDFFQKINASAVFHNDHTAFRVDWMPFAGLKESGYGIGGIKYTMDDMQVEKMLVLKK
jgi:acyl-CoA reductase-like NAD-dependent aldehyde dehydrogenase